MMNRIETHPSAFASAAGRPRSAGRAGWGMRRIRRAWYSSPPFMEEVERRLRSHPSLIASLTPEQLARVKGWDGPDVLGHPNGPGRTF